METNDFRDAKVGDRVWDFLLGWGRISKVDPDKTFFVNFTTNSYSRWYDLSGFTRETRTLFWDEIKITPPPRPKRKVIRTMDMWVNIYTNRYGIAHDSLDNAIKSIDDPGKFIKTMKFTSEPFWVEE